MRSFGTQINTRGGKYVNTTLDGKVVLPDDNNESVLFRDEQYAQIMLKVALMLGSDGPRERLYMCVQGGRTDAERVAGGMCREFGLQWRLADIYDHKPGRHVWVEFLRPQEGAEA